MERLTERFSNGQVGVKGCGNNCRHEYKYCNNHLEDCPTINELYEKLATYEDAEEQKLQCRPGDMVWCIEEYEDEAELAGYLFMAMCGEFVIVTSHYVHCGTFETQLMEMAEESLDFDGVSVNIFEKENVFLTKSEAEQALARMRGKNE